LDELVRADVGFKVSRVPHLPNQIAERVNQMRLALPQNRRYTTAPAVSC